jgi:hypothetical protein
LVLLGSSCGSFAQTPAAPASLTVEAYECHTELRWPLVSGAVSYRIYRREAGQLNFTQLAQNTQNQGYIDWTCDEGQQLSLDYAVSAVSSNGVEGPKTNTVAASTAPMSDEALFDMVQRQTFRYFWDFGHPVSGMARERNSSGQTVTTGGTGFGIMSILVGVERGWITREQGLDRLIRIVSFLQFADRFHGAFPHWMDGTTGNVIPFSQYDNGGDLVETAFLIQGLLAARQYFDQATPLELALNDAITDIWEDVEWDWYRRNNSNVLYWHWSPNYAWQMNFALRGFNEAQIVYLLAAASPTHGVPATLYNSGWRGGNYNNPSIHFGKPIYCGPFGGGPLFFAHYSYLGFDPRPYRDPVCNYFIRNRNHALIQHAYCIANPEQHQGYSGDCWGLTASDNPFGYLAHDIAPSNDNGTISPTAALASFPYTADESFRAMRHFYRVRGQRLWGIYGFYDAFNLDQNWYANSYLAIDQGPIVVMMENYRSQLLWRMFMRNPEIEPALLAMGFTPDNSVATSAPAQQQKWQLMGNPVPAGSPLSLYALQSGAVQVSLFDVQGKLLVQSQKEVVGGQLFTLELPKRNRGLHLLKIKDQSTELVFKIILE